VEVQGERGSGGFAFLDGTGDEVGCDDFHCAGGGVEVGWAYCCFVVGVVAIWGIG
jgi:hypothetical protein